MKKVWMFIIGVIGISSHLSASLYLQNDSPFILRAVVIAANGVNMGEKILQPNATAYIEDELGGSDPVGPQSQQFENYSTSLTPYTVFWYCNDGTLYSNCENIPAGGLASANGCQGNKYCKPPKQKKQQNDESESEDQDE